MSRRSREILTGAAVVVLFALPLLPEILGSRRLIFRDALITHWPWRRAAVEMLKAGEVPFIDARASGGEPMLANPNAVLLYPTFLLERVFSPESAFNLHYLLHVLWAFFGARALARRLRVSDGAAFVSGIAFAFSGTMLSFGSAFMNSSAAAAWLPWCAAAALDLGRASTRTAVLRSGAALGLALGLQLLAGEPALSLLTVLFAAGVAFGATPSEPPRRFVRLAAAFAASGVLALALAAPLLLPLRQVLPMTYRGQHAFSKEAFGAVPLTPTRLLEWLFPSLSGNPSIVGMEPRWLGEGPLLVYVWSVALGVIPLLLVAAAALRRGFWSRKAAGLSAAALGTLLLSFGFAFPLYRILYAIAPLRRLRYPIKFYLITSLCVALLAGLAADHLARRRAGRRELLLCATLLAVFAAAWALSAPGGPVASLLIARLGDSREPFAEAFRIGVRGDAIAGLVSVTLVALLLRLRPGSPKSSASSPAVDSGYVFGMLTLFAALVWGLPLFVTGPSEELARTPALARIVAGEGRLYAPDPPAPTLRSLEPEYPRRLPRVAKVARLQIQYLYPATGSPFGVASLFETDPDGSYGFYNRVASEAAAAADPLERDRLLRLYGARFALAREGGEHPLFHPKTGLSIGDERLVLFEDTHPLPELRWAGRVHSRPSLSSAISLLKSDEFVPETDVLLRGDRFGGPPLPQPAARLSNAVVRASSARVEVDAERVGFVIFSRTFFPSWKANVDGVPAPVQVANARDLAVRVEAGRHHVEIAYDPSPFRLGVIVQAAALLAAIVAAVVSRRARA
ncbi:MAG TPA: hypothetical protein VGK26_08635 [Thermoanaerobaculia bacterium]